MIEKRDNVDLTKALGLINRAAKKVRTGLKSGISSLRKGHANSIRIRYSRTTL